MDVSDHEILVGSGDKHIRNFDIRMGTVGRFYLCSVVFSCIGMRYVTRRARAVLPCFRELSG